jgi:hypothetical protein
MHADATARPAGQRAAVRPRRRWVMSHLRTVGAPALPIQALWAEQDVGHSQPAVVPAHRMQ